MMIVLSRPKLNKMLAIGISIFLMFTHAVSYYDQSLSAIIYDCFVMTVIYLMTGTKQKCHELSHVPGMKGKM